MYKIFFKMGVMLVIMLGGMSYMFVVKTGRSPLEMLNLTALMGNKTSILSSDRPKTLLNAESKHDSFSSKGDKTKIYKWTDEQGTTHYTNRAPLEEVNAETISIDPNLNSIAGLKLPKQTEVEEVSSASAGDLNVNPYSPQGVKEIMDKAKNVQNLLDENAKKKKEMLERLQ